MSRSAFVTAVAVILLVSVPAFGQSRDPATGHYYERVTTSASWTAAKTAAALKTYNGMNGYLVCVTSSTESAFLVSTFGSGGSYWIGAYQPPTASEPSGGWTWVSGEKWSYSSWNKGEPNDVGNEDYAMMYASTGLWNDTKGIGPMNYIVEYEPSADMSINAGESATTSTAVTLTFNFTSGSDAGNPQIRVRNGTGTWSDWTTWSPTMAWTLEATEGEKTVSAELKDDYGLVYPVSDKIFLDSAPPTGSVVIEGGDAWTNSSNVALDLTYQDTISSVASMRFRIPGEKWSPWVPAAPSAGFTLAAGEGLRAVEVEFADAAGNVSLVATDDIGVDLTAPTVAIVAAGGEEFSGERAIPITLDAKDTGSGVESMRFREIGVGSWEEWLPFESPTTYTVRYGDTAKNIEVQVRDRAGNMSADTADPVTLDLTEPEITHFRISAGALYLLPGRNLSLELSAMDNHGGSGATDFCVSFDRGANWTPWRAIIGGWLNSVERPAQDGILQIRAMVRDAVGNESDADEAEIYLVEEDLPVATGGGKLTGSISPEADVDAFVVDMAKGDMLSVKVKGKATGEEIILAIDIAGAEAGVLHRGRYPDDMKKVMIKGFVAPATDRYYVLLRLDKDSPARTGAHTLVAKVKQNKLGKKGKGVSEDGRVELMAAAGGMLKVTLKAEGLTAAGVTLTGPDGPVEFIAKEGRKSMKLQATLDAGTGTYEIVVDPAVEVSWKWKLKLPKKVKLAIPQ